MVTEEDLHNFENRIDGIIKRIAVSALPHVRKESTGTRTVQDAKQAELDQIIGSIDEIVYKVDLHDKSFSYVSPQVEKIFGYTKYDFMDLVSGHIQGEFYDERDKNRVITSRYDYIAGCLLGNVGKYEVEYRARDAVGQSLWIMETMNPVYDKKEPVIGCFIGTLRDITKQKRKEIDLQTTIHLLKEKLTRTSFIFENAAEGIFQTTLDGRYISANPALARIFGYNSPEDMIISVSDIGKQHDIYPEQRKERLRILDEKGIIENYEAQMYRKDGSVFWVSINVRMVPDDAGNPLYYEGFITDITTRKRAEEALKEKTHFLERILESTPNLIYVYDLYEQRNLFTNREIIKFLGYTSEQIKAFGSTLFQNILHPDDVPFVAKHHAECAIAGDHEVLEIDYRMKNADGQWRLMRSRDIVFSRNQMGKGQQILGVTEDITDRKLMEESLLRSENLSSLGMLSAGLAHELRNPLAIISSCAQFCLKKQPPPDSVADNFQRIYRNALRANALVNDLLDFARPTQIKRKLVNIHDVLEGMLVVALGSKGTATVPVTYKAIYSKEQLFIMGDEDALTRVFLNIFNNAIHVGRHIVIETHHIGSRNVVKIDITDDGPGIPEENRNRVFDPFFTTKKGGTGLGLSISHTIVREHGGAIEVVTGGKVGTTFSVILPVAPRGSNASLKEHLEKSSRQSKTPEEKKKQ
jgi:PAS domain S-box-containing protein